MKDKRPFCHKTTVEHGSDRPHSKNSSSETNHENENECLAISCHGQRYFYFDSILFELEANGYCHVAMKVGETQSFVRHLEAE